MKKEVCLSIKNAINDNSKTLQDYVKNYKIQLLNKEEVEKKVGSKLPDFYVMNEGDFFFIGYELKESSKEKKFVWSDMFTFIVSKSEGTWKIKSLQ